MRASKLQPALLGGLVIGVLSALPVINMGNCLCCLWVILGGVVATYLLQQAQPTAVGTADGAIVGLLAGLVGAVVGTALSIPIQWLMGSMGADTLQRVLNQSGGDMPPEARAVLERAWALQAEHEDRNTSAMIAWLLAEVCWKLGDAPTARTLTAEARRLYQELGNTEQLQDIDEVLRACGSKCQ